MKTTRTTVWLAIVGVWLACLGARAAAPPDALVIEAERFSRRTPDDGSFCVPVNERSASGGKAVFKFYVKGVEGKVPGDK